MIVNAVDTHYVSIQKQIIQEYDEKNYNILNDLTYDDMEWCSVMISVLENPCEEAQSTDFELSIETD